MVYLLHFDKPVGGRAWHYTGYCADDGLEARLVRHKSGNGARILAAAVQQGVAWVVAATFTGYRDIEKQLKMKKHASRFCPICKKEKHVQEASDK